MFEFGTAQNQYQNQNQNQYGGDMAQHDHPHFKRQRDEASKYGYSPSQGAFHASNHGRGRGRGFRNNGHQYQGRQQHKSMNQGSLFKMSMIEDPWSRTAFLLVNNGLLSPTIMSESFGLTADPIQQSSSSSCSIQDTVVEEEEQQMDEIIDSAGVAANVDIEEEDKTSIVDSGDEWAALFNKRRAEINFDPTDHCTSSSVIK